MHVMSANCGDSPQMGGCTRMITIRTSGSHTGKSDQRRQAVHLTNERSGYESGGYVEISTHSGTGSFILLNYPAKKAVKISQDEAYDQFVQFVDAQTLACFPRIDDHRAPLGPFVLGSNDPYTVTETELLEDLDVVAQQQVYEWIQNVLPSVYEMPGASAPTSDPYGLLAGLQAMSRWLKSKCTNIGIDNKPGNVLIRRSGSGVEYVITDGFGGC